MVVVVLRLKMCHPRVISLPFWWLTLPGGRIITIKRKRPLCRVVRSLTVSGVEELLEEKEYFYKNRENEVILRDSDVP